MLHYCSWCACSIDSPLYPNSPTLASLPSLETHTHIDTNLHTQIHPAADLFKSRTGEHRAPISYYAGISQTPAIVYRAPMGPYYQWHHQALCCPQQQKEREYYRKKKLERQNAKYKGRGSEENEQEKRAMGETNRVGRCGEQGGKWKKLLDNAWTDKQQQEDAERMRAMLGQKTKKKNQIIQEEWVLKKHLLGVESF